MRQWVLDEPLFSEQYARSRKLRAQALEDRIVEKLDGITSENAAAARVEIDTLKWFMSKLDRESYGDKPQETHVTTHVHNHVSVEEQKQLQERHKAALARMNR